jgi:3-hydroxyacyl-[acyl-carrier-protein] dehydratase
VSHPSAAVVTASVPHRYPMLLVDRLDSLRPTHSGSALKAVTFGESHREGAVDEGPYALPPTLMVDALGQVAIMVMNAGAAGPPARWVLGAIERMDFFRAVRPGETMRMEATVRRAWQRIRQVAVRASVDGETAAEGLLVLSRDGIESGGAR